MPPAHPLLPAPSHDERARLGYVVDLKNWLERRAAVAIREPLEREVLPSLAARGAPPELSTVRRELAKHVAYRHWQALMRDAQELMWSAAGECVDRQLPALRARAAELAAPRPARLAPDFTVPHYLTAVDTHCMPGSYYAESGPDDVRQGALFDLAAAIYHRGRNGGMLNDGRGHTIVAHVRERFPDLRPRRILEIGCTVGHSAVAVARAFPGAEMHAIDVGAPVLRWAAARAAALGVEVHYAQANAERTEFEDASFDLVYSTAVLHETSNAALPRVLAECRRLLRPGGVVAHLEVPVRYRDLGLAEQVRAEFETWCNNEPFWRAACTADLVGGLERAGFAEVREGYQATRPPAGTPGFGSTRGPVHTCWYVVSGRVPPAAEVA